MQAGPTSAKILSHTDKTRALPWYYTFQASNTVFVLLTIFGPVFPLFMHEAGLSKSQIGGLLAIPHLFTLMALLITGFVIRRGPKRIFIVMNTMRSIIIAGLLAVPLARSWLTPSQTFMAVAGIIAAFAFCRAMAETGYLPWEKEFIPDRIRGKVYAVNGIICGITALCTSLAAALILRRLPGVAGYQLLILTGIAFSLVSVWGLRSIPGGQPAPPVTRPRPMLEDLTAPLRDRNFRRFLLGNGLFVLACGVFPFLPLYLQIQLGLPADKVMIMDMSVRGGILLTSYFWGWSADRFGGRPVAITGILMVLVFPLSLCFLPGGFQPLIILLAALYGLYGMAIQGYLVGLTRYLYADAVPARAGAGYYSIHYAAAGICTAAGPLLAGYLLDCCAPLRQQWGFFTITPFTPMLLLSAALFGAAAAICRRLRSVDAMPTGKFLSMLIQGNPLLAFGSILRYQFAWNEDERITTTERLGRAKNTASADELLESLQDPSFNVRYEAILAIARLPATAQLTEALVGVLRGQEPDLSVAAGWALGRLGDPRAIPALQETMQSEYALLRSRAARSLAILGDQASAPAMLQAMRVEQHDAIKVAYATALGSLRVAAALPDILELLRKLARAPLRNETTLAAARILSCDQRFTRLWRAARHEPGAACAAALQQAGRLFAGIHPPPDQPPGAWHECVQALQAGDFNQAASRLELLLQRIPDRQLPAAARLALDACRPELARPDGAGVRMEYLMLAIAILQNAPHEAP